MITSSVIPSAGQPGAQDVSAIEAMLKARFDSGFPFLLLPVRIETRFVQAEVPIDRPVMPADLLARIGEIRAALIDIANRNLVTDVAGKGAVVRRRLKDVDEAALYAFVDGRLTAADAAAARVVADAPSCYEGTAADVAALQAAIAALTPAADGAAVSLAHLRSPWHRQRLISRLADFRQGRFTAAVRSVDGQTLPVLRLFTEGGPVLKRLMRTCPGPVVAAPGTARATFARGAVLSDSAADLLAGLRRRLDARSRNADPRADARAVADGALRVAALAGEIVALPDARRQALAADGQHIAEQARQVAAAVDAWARLGSADTQATATLADNLRRAAATLETAVGQIPAAENALTGATTGRPTRVVNQLRVRVFPDDVFIQTHEAELTAAEIESGQAFWRETLAGGSDEALKRSAWRALVRKHGSRRAAWIARQLEPTLPDQPFDSGPLMRALDLLERRIDEVIRFGPQRLASLNAPMKAVAAAIPDGLDLHRSARERLTERLATLRAKQDALAKTVATVGARVVDREPLKTLAATLKRAGTCLERAEAAARGDGEPSVTPVYPVLQPKAATWTQSPHSTVLPERFLVVAVTTGRVLHAVAGKPVDPALKLGLDPDPAHEAVERFSIDADGELQVGDSIRWIVDYDEAVNKGMAVSVDISADEARDGFDRLYVLGIKDATAADAQKQIEALLEDHHFGQDGLGFLTAGTPTNNTEQAASGFASADDAEASYDLERSDPLFTYNPARPQDASDALRFARAVGIQPAAVDHVANAGTKEVSEAFIANEALWPATVGPYLEDFLGSVIGADAIRRLRAFFVANVVGSGIAPVLRIGDEPYGLLATTAFSRYEPATGTVLPQAPTDGAPDADQKHDARFNLILRDVLAIAHDDWSRIREARVKHAHSRAITDPQQHFLDMLGQDPTSSSWGYRYAVNIAQRQPPRQGMPSFDFTYPRTAAGAIATAADQGPIALLSRFAAVFRAAAGLAPDAPLRDPKTGLVSAAFAPTFDVLLGANAYRVRYLAAPRRFTGIVVDDRAGTWIPQLLAASMSSLAEEARQDQLRSRCLLYVLLRYALLGAQRDAVRDILIGDGLYESTWAASGSGDHFLVVDLFGPSANTKWSWLFQPLSTIDARAGGELPTGAGSLRQYLDHAGNATLEHYLSSRGANATFQGSPRRAAHDATANQLARHGDAVSALAVIPPDRLARLVQDHLDLCSHRLDAWRLGLANQRLGELRSRNPLGLHVGAFGWVENLRPDPPRHPAASVPAALQRRGQTIFESESNEGFVHAPSLSHAVAAAILRSGYLSETARRDLDNRMAVNLSSRRVRAALDLIDGLGAGSALSSLLGYRIERFLHEAYESQNVTLDDMIYKLRRAFPALAPVDPDAPASTQAERAIVDGLSLLGTVRRSLEAAGLTIAVGATLFDTLRDNGSYTGHPWGVVQHDGSAILPATSDIARLDGFLRAIDHIADALDAVGDLALAEAVYQLGRGNHARAAAVLGALAEGKPLPRPEIVDMPRTGTMVTHRLFLAVPHIDATPLSRTAVANDETRDASRRTAAPAAWAAIPMTPRACAEPSLNRWLGAALGDPAQIVARVVERESGDEVAAVSAQDLGLQPIDVLALIGPGAEVTGGELGARILAFALPATLDPKSPPALRKVIFEPGVWSVGKTTFLQAAPLCQAVHDLLGKARPAVAADFLDETAKGSGAPPATDRAELETRARGALAELEAIGASLAALLSDGQVTDASALDDVGKFLTDHAGVFRGADGDIVPSVVLALRADFAARLLRAASLSIPGALPPSHYRDDRSFARELLERTEGALTEAAARRVRAKPVVDAADTSDALVKALRLVLGEDAPILPAFTLRNGDAVKAALDADLLRDAGRRPVERWLHGVAAVRDRTGFLRQALVMADLSGMALPTPGVAQLPLVAGDRWLGVELPAGVPTAAPKLSLVVLGCDALDTDGQPNAAILVDEWNEVIPGDAETTGIALNADQPDASPPQAILLVVPPAPPPANGTGRWSLEDLVRALDETFDLARNRLVEPEHLADGVYAQVLPAIAGELIPDAIRERGAPLGDRVPLDFGAAGHGAG